MLIPYPDINGKTTDEQISQIRNYLFRIADILNIQDSQHNIAPVRESSSPAKTEKTAQDTFNLIKPLLESFLEQKATK